MRQINYYPANAGWSLMWEKFPQAQIDHDFGVIAGLHADEVRVIVQPHTFGYPVPSHSMEVKLSTVISLASEHGLKVHLTLFDWWHDFAQIASSKTWATEVLAPFKGDPRIARVELKNEVDPTIPELMAWVKVMLPYVQQVSGRPCTVSIADKGVAAFQSLVAQLKDTPPDLWDYHYYGPAVNVLDVLGAVKDACDGLPLIIGETGQSTYRKTDLNVQAHYLGYIFDACSLLGLPMPAPWTLYDFTPTAIPGGAGSGKEYQFGLFTSDGKPKPSAGVVAAWFKAGA
jgi:hypothetical protein